MAQLSCTKKNTFELAPLITKTKHLNFLQLLTCGHSADHTCFTRSRSLHGFLLLL
uniref:Uncharacterized protein n=1 Tax=Arundo donax TaxID=35708 RepID=A0A0A9ATE6_ARUDO